MTDNQTDPVPVEGDVPAFVSTSEQSAGEKTYIVTGVQTVLGHAPGEVFTTTLTIEQEESYLLYGHLAEADTQAIVSEENQASQESERPSQSEDVKE